MADSTMSTLPGAPGGANTPPTPTPQWDQASTAAPAWDQQQQAQNQTQQDQDQQTQGTPSTMVKGDVAPEPVTAQSVADKIGAAFADFGAGVSELPRALLRGTENFAGAVTAPISNVVTKFDNAVGIPDKGDISMEPEVAEPESVTGKFFTGAIQFAESMAAVGQFAKAAGVGEAATVGGKIASGATKAGIASAVGFNGHDPNLANLIEAHPSLSNPITQYLQSNPGDSEAEGRFKQALVGLGVGALGDSIFAGAKVLKALRSGDTSAAVEAAAQAQIAASKARTSVPGETQQDLPFLPPKAVTAEDMAKPKNPALDKGLTSAMTPEAIDDYRRTLGDVLESQKNEDIGWGAATDGLNHNFLTWKDNTDALTSLNVLSKVQQEAINTAKGGDDSGVRTWNTAQKMADVMGTSPDKLISSMRNLLPQVSDLDAKMKAAGTLLANLNHRTTQIATMLNEGRAVGPGLFNSLDEAKASFATHASLLDEMNNLFIGSKANIARAMNFMKTGYKPDASIAESTDSMAAGSDEALYALARKYAISGNTEEDIEEATKNGIKLARGGPLTRAMQAANSVFVNSLLSFKTLGVKAAGDFFNGGIIQPAEQAIKGAIMLDKNQVLQAGQQYVGMARGLVDSIRLAGKAFMSGNQILDASAHGYPDPLAVGDGSVVNSLANGDPVAAFVNALGKTISLPTRLLTSQDELAKNLIYRGKVYGDAWRQATEQGLNGQAKSQFMANAMKAAFDEDGNATNEAALDYAQRGTYTNSLQQQPARFGTKTLGAGVQNLVGSVPPLRQFIPFMKIVTNLQRFTWTHTPLLNLAQKEYFDDLMAWKNGDVERSASAAAKSVSGGLLWGGALLLAANGHITGSGPTDPNARRELEQTGWLPDSFVLQHDDGTKTYIQHSRMDPLSSFLGLAADVYKLAPYLSDNEYGKLASGLGLAVLRNFNGKAYYTGINNLFDALSGKGSDDTSTNRVSRFMQTYLSGYVPGSLNNFNDDPYMREAHSVVEAMMKRIPGYSEGVDPVRNTLGEKVPVTDTLGPRWISPFATSESKNDPVQQELARQAVLAKTGFTPPSKMLKLPHAPSGATVDLTQFRGANGYSAYDRYQELVSTEKVGGKSLRDALSEVINSPQYQNKLTDSTTQYEGSRKQAIDTVVGKYRLAAQALLLKENKDVYNAALLSAQNAAGAKYLNPTKAAMPQ